MNSKFIIMVISIIVMWECSSSPEELLQDAQLLTSQGKYEKALLRYGQLINDHANSSYAIDAYFRMVNINLDNLREYEKGFNLLNEIVERFPETSEAMVAEEDIKQFPDWLYNKSKLYRDNNEPYKALKVLELIMSKFSDDELVPKAHYVIADIHLKFLSEPQKAIEIFKEVSSAYEDTPHGPHAQFMAAYIYANVTKDLTLAEEEYSLFLEMYPDHELRTSVEFELEYLGQDVDDVVKLKEANRELDK
ncbi:MAG: tetratricopeptide repeat protein [Candidatus Neomarinimicrobiota bacterium]